MSPESPGVSAGAVSSETLGWRRGVQLRRISIKDVERLIDG
jgi:hypothetical protein